MAIVVWLSNDLDLDEVVISYCPLQSSVFCNVFFSNLETSSSEFRNSA